MYVFVHMCEHEYMDGCVYIDVLFYIFMMYGCISIFNERDVCFLFFSFPSVCVVGACACKRS